MRAGEMSETQREDRIRVRQIRTRVGLSQADLAEATGIDLKTIKAIENEEQDAKTSTLRKIAAALGVPTGALFTPPNPDVPPARRHDVHALRALLQPAPSVDATDGETLTSLLGEADLALRDNDLTAAMPAVAELVPHARAAVDNATTDQELTSARRVLVEAYDRMATLLVLLGEPALSISAADQLDQIATAEGNPVWTGRAASARNWGLMRRGEFSKIVEASETAAVALRPEIDTRDAEQLMVWEKLMRWISGAAARNNQPDLAEEGARRAGIAAAMLGQDRIINGHATGPTLVALRGVENAVIVEDYGKANRLASAVPRRARMLPRDRQRHALDVANIALEHKHPDRATVILSQLRDDAPVWLQSQPYAVTVGTKLVRAAKRRLSPEARALADFIGVPA